VAADSVVNDGVADAGVAGYGAAGERVDENHADGRRLRRAQNREAVIDALLALFRDGNYQPGMAEIAARAGLSLRSVFRYFDDVDDLHRAAASRQIALVLPLLEVPVPAAAPTAEKVAAVVAARAALYEQIGPAARALRAGAHRHAPLAGELARNRAFLRSQLAAVFGPAPAALLSALDVLCSFESWELLRHDQGLSVAAAERALTDAIRALLGLREEVSA
jgi:AcrR family transcriptional regulator